MTRCSPIMATVVVATTLLVGCVEEDGRIDLIITHEASVLFGGVLSTASESQEIHYGNLMKEADYVAHEEALSCGTLRPADSYIDITRLEADSDEAALIVQLQVQHTGGTWVPLASFEGEVRARDIYTLDHAAVWLDDEGVAMLAEIALSDQPVFDARVTVIASVDLQDLALALRLQLMLSSDAAACP
jgi:hypothetical protein